MHILALETTGARASAAIIDEKGTVLEKRGQGVQNHLQNLTPMVKELLDENGLQLRDITEIAVSKGPGSFTGIRIGVSTARALAQILKVRTIGVPTLKAFAYNAPGWDGLICPVFDARRSQVYAGAYMWAEGKILEAVRGAPYDIDDFLEKVAQADRSGAAGRLFFGDGTTVYRDRFSESELAPEDRRFQSAASAARLAKDMSEAGLALDYEDLKPDYMRKAEAERKLEQNG